MRKYMLVEVKPKNILFQEMDAQLHVTNKPDHRKTMYYENEYGFNQYIGIKKADLLPEI